MGGFWLAALAIVCGANFWLAGAWLGLVRPPEAPVFVFAARPLWQLAACWAVLAPAALVAARTRAIPVVLARQMVILLAMPLLALALAASPLREHAAPFIYVFLDLHRWVLAAAVLLLASGLATPAGTVLTRLRRFVERRIAGWPGDSGWLDAALVIVLVGSSLATSPVLRFQSSLNGDEPKYVRYLENWYQGRGMNVSGLEPVARLQPGRPALMDNLRRLRTATGLVAGDLWQDGRRLVGLSFTPPPSEAAGTGQWFVEGKRGGTYQVHSPGLSFLLFPGYVIDRTFLNWSSDFHPQFPSNLYCTATLLLLLYAAWGVALFRLLAAYTGRPGLSWGLACGIFLSLPATAFAYQYYPEAAGGLAIALLARFIWLREETRTTPVVAHGLLAGFLPWLHLRFGVVTIVSLAIFAIRNRHSVRALAAFVGAFLVPVAALGAYYYHVTGSFAPWALYALSTDAVPPF
ncbi:MAG: hypothetical protein EHM13_15485, partial [Acidobacteria bacterium]